MAKNETSEKTTDSLIERFTSLEKRLVDLLGNSSIDVEEKVTRATLKKKLSKYIKNVEEAKVVFEEYEMVAKEIEKLAGKKEDGEKLSKVIVELREEEKIEDYAETYADEIVVSEKGDVSAVKKKKKKVTSSSKEL